MATSKNNNVLSAVRTENSPLRRTRYSFARAGKPFPSGNFDRKGTEADSALVDDLQRWGRVEAASDMKRLKDKESTSKNEMEIAMCGLYASPIYHGIVGDFVNGPSNEISVLRLCGRMYLAGKLSATRHTSTPPHEL